MRSRCVGQKGSHKNAVQGIRNGKEFTGLVGENQASSYMLPEYCGGKKKKKLRALFYS